MGGADSRMLAMRLAAMPDDRLAAFLDQRRVSPQSSVRTFFDLADAQLTPEAVAAAVAALPRPLLVSLSARRPLPPEGRLAGIVDDDGIAFDEAMAALGDAPLGDADETAAAPADTAQAAQAAERAFTALASLADVLLSAMHTPLARVQGGAVGVSDRRRLVSEQIARDADELDDLVALAEVCGLLRADGRSWFVSDRGAEWVRRSTADRWVVLVTAWRDSLPEGVRDGAGTLPFGAWPAAYPLDPAWPERASLLRREAGLLGLVASSGAEPGWTAPVRSGTAVDAAPLVALLPGEVDRLYLQNDLTAIAPGPLAPALDVRLRSMADRESHAQASTYRFTEATLEAALAAGESADGIRGFLSGLSLTGIPQPLDYLIDRTAARHGLVRVSLELQTGHTIVSSRDPQLLETIAVDQALRMLGLIPDQRLLRTRATRESVYWALADAHYPVIAIDEDGTTLAMGRRRAEGTAAPSRPVDVYAPLIQRLREAHGDDPDAAWRARELDAAVRARAVVIVEVAMPDGSSREMTIEASGLGGGRLRGVDRASDVERSFPVSLIRSVRPA